MRHCFNWCLLYSLLDEKDGRFVFFLHLCQLFQLIRGKRFYLVSVLSFSFKVGWIASTGELCGFFLAQFDSPLDGFFVTC